MSHLKPDVFNEAVDAWFEHCKIQEVEPQQPSLSESSMDDTGMVTLRNRNGFLARYSSHMKRILTNL
jgi:hypothetical protein